MNELGTGVDKQSQVSEQMAFIEKALSELHSITDEFSNRLSRLMRDPTPSDEKKSETVEKAIVPFASELRDHHMYLEKANGRLADILNRLEL